MRPAKCRLIFVGVLVFCISVRAQEPSPASALGETLLHPLSITLTGHLDVPSRPTSTELATKYIGDQIEQKRATEAAAAQLPAFWSASFWKYLPKSSGGTLNSPTTRDDDPAVTPTYLMLTARLLEREADMSDKTAKLFFAK